MAATTVSKRVESKLREKAESIGVIHWPSGTPYSATTGLDQHLTLIESWGGRLVRYCDTWPEAVSLAEQLNREGEQHEQDPTAA